MGKSEKIVIDVPQQGISQKLAVEEAIEFLNMEPAYYSKHANLFDAEVSLFGSNFGQSGRKKLLADISASRFPRREERLHCLHVFVCASASEGPLLGQIGLLRSIRNSF